MEAKKQLDEICVKHQREWEEQHLFEADPDSREKFMTTFPFPYMNGLCHLGHLFSASKCEFAAGYHRLIGENALFPFAFHVTGQPICGAAKKLKNELFPEETNEAVEEKKQCADSSSKIDNIGQFKSKKAKTVAKSGGLTQFQILKGMNIPEAEIPQFIDPLHWVDYFPPICRDDMKSFGARIDWRRSFITTDKNPCYDHFIQWQMRKMRANGYIKFGERFTIWSPMDNQVCMDHDRSLGEGVGVQEYCIVKCALLKNESSQKFYSQVGEKDVIYLSCATLRPETMCGQTNVWVQPEEQYLMIRISEDEVIITGEHAAYNMAFQHRNNGLPNGEISKILEFPGQELINCLVKAPLTPVEQIPVLPLLTILMTKGTGVVTSVPSDAPDDYAALMDILHNNDNICEKYGINSAVLRDIKIIDIIEIPGIGVGAAKLLCDQKGVKSQHDRELLKEIKEICYKQGFYEGKMISGHFAGEKVSECKEKARNLLLQTGQAFIYAEPESQVISRSGCECVVALTEQWYIDYGEEAWKEKAKQCLAQLETYSDEVRNQFLHVLDWLKQWALSRSFGLGTKIPWDQKFIVESLSDSTIYNAYYTIAHILQNGSLDGSKSPIPIELINDELFEYVFDFSEEIPEGLKQYTSLLETMKHNFKYFYPVDLRCSGKDLIQNHLTFYIYTHVAIFPPKYWPRGIRSNGHLMVNDEKMSKSKGNFVTASAAIEKYTPDGVRYALAEAGDTGDDANFKTEIAENAIVKLVNWLSISKDILNQSAERPDIKVCDQIFQAQVYDAANRADAAYRKCRFREGILATFGDLSKARDLYCLICQNEGIACQKQIVIEFLELQAQLLGVCCPHVAEEMWMNVLHHEKSIFTSTIDRQLQEKAKSTAKYVKIYDFVCAAVNRLNQRLLDSIKPKKGQTITMQRPKKGIVYVALSFELWQEGICQYLQEMDRSGQILEKNTPGLCRQYALEKLGVSQKESKRLMKFITDQLALYKIDGADALVTKMPFDEKKVYQEYQYMIKQSLKLDDVEIYEIGEGPLSPEQCAAAAPGRPIIFFE